MVSVTLLRRGSLAWELHMHILTSTLQLWACAKTRTLGKCDACHHSTIENYYQSRKSEGSFKQNTILIFILHLTNQTYSKVVQRWAQIQLIFFLIFPQKWYGDALKWLAVLPLGWALLLIHFCQDEQILNVNVVQQNILPHSRRARQLTYLHVLTCVAGTARRPGSQAFLVIW